MEDVIVFGASDKVITGQMTMYQRVAMRACLWFSVGYEVGSSLTRHV